MILEALKSVGWVIIITAFIYMVMRNTTTIKNG